MSFPTTTADISAFQGWYWGNRTDSAEKITCPSPQTVSISSTYLDCLSTSAAALPTTCESGVLQYNDNSNITCVSPASCYTMTIAETNPPDSSMTMRYMCANSDWIYSTVYRVYYIPESVYATMTTSSASTTFSTAASTTATPTHTPTATSTSTSETSSKTISNNSSSLSGGSIAGIVVGCLAAGAILTALIFLRKRLIAFFSKGRQDYNPAPQGSPVTEQVHEIGSSGVHAHEMQTKDVHEMPATDVHEMGNVHEIGTTEISDK